jgi:hypothetical protein
VSALNRGSYIEYSTVLYSTQLLQPKSFRIAFSHLLSVFEWGVTGPKSQAMITMSPANTKPFHFKVYMISATLPRWGSLLLVHAVHGDWFIIVPQVGSSVKSSIGPDSHFVPGDLHLVLSDPGEQSFSIQVRM